MSRRASASHERGQVVARQRPEEVDVEAVGVVLLAPDGDQSAGVLVGRDDVERGVQLVDERVVEGVHAPVQAHHARAVDPVDVHPAPCARGSARPYRPARGAARYRFARAHGGRHTRPVVAQFVDETNLHAKAGDGGAGAVAFRREAHVAQGRPRRRRRRVRAATSGWWPTTTWRRCSRSATTRSGGRPTAPTAAARAATAARGEDVEVPVPPRAPSSATSDGEVLADLVHGRRPLPGRRGRAGRARQRPVPVQPPPGARPSPSRARRARSAGCASSSSCWPTWPSSGSRTWASRTLISAHLGRQAQDRRLPVHHARAPPRRRAPRRRRRVRRGRHPRA